jgi:hypothetical protein
VSRSAGVICAALIAVLTLASSAPALAAEAPPPLAIAGVADEPVPVVFNAHEGGQALGALSFVLETGANTAGQLSLEFLPQQAGQDSVLVEAQAGAKASAPIVLQGKELPGIGKEAAVPLVLEFREPLGAAPAADGLLIARVKSESGAPYSTALRVEGQLGDVTVQPVKVTLQHSDLCLFSCGHESATVQVSGPGTQALSQSGVIATAALGGDRAGTTTVMLSRHGSEWTVNLKEPSLGEMSGKMALVEGMAGAPTVEVVVNDGVWFGAAVLIVLIGAVCGSLLIPQWGVGRRRRILSNALEAALQRYEQAIAAATAEESEAGPVKVERPAGYPLSGDLGPKDSWNSKGCQPYQGPRGVRALLCRIVTSRSDADFAECEKQATGLIAAIDGWIALEPIVAKAERRLELAKAAKPKNGKKFENTKICVELRQLVDEVIQFRPADLVKVDEKGNKLQAMTSAVVKAEAVWVATVKVLAAPGALTDLLRGPVEALPGQEQLQPATGGIVAPPTLAHATSMSSSFGVSLNQLQQLGSELPAAAPGSEADTADAGVADAIGNAVMTARLESFPLDADAQAPVVVAHGDSDEGFSFKSPSGADLLLSLVSGTAAAVAYTATVYTDTWGSWAQVATALTAGFLAPSVAQWAALPIFRSVRLQAPAPKADADKPAAAS